MGHFLVNGQFVQSSIATAVFFGVNAIGAELNRTRK